MEKEASRSKLFIVEIVIYCILLIGIVFYSIYNCFFVYPNNWCIEILYCIIISVILFIAFGLFAKKKRIIANLLWLVSILLLAFCPFCSILKDDYIDNYNMNIMKYRKLVAITYDNKGNKTASLNTDFSEIPYNALDCYVVTDVEGLIKALKENNRSLFNKVSVVFNENEYKTEDEINTLLNILDLNKIYEIGILRQNENSFNYGIIYGIGGEHSKILEKISLRESSLDFSDVIKN